MNKENKDSLVYDFLKKNPLGKIQFPKDNVFIGVSFEAGGTHEDWGFVVIEAIPFKVNNEHIVFMHKEIGEGRTIEEAIEKATKYYKAHPMEVTFDDETFKKIIG